MKNFNVITNELLELSIKDDESELCSLFVKAYNEATLEQKHELLIMSYTVLFSAELTNTIMNMLYHRM